MVRSVLIAAAALTLAAPLQARTGADCILEEHDRLGRTLTNDEAVSCIMHNTATIPGNPDYYANKAELDGLAANEAATSAQRDYSTAVRTYRADVPRDYIWRK